MVYQLGTTSLKRLEGVHPDLIAVTKLALSISKQDFMVVEGVRSLAQQQKYVSKCSYYPDLYSDSFLPLSWE